MVFSLDPATGDVAFVSDATPNESEAAEQLKQQVAAALQDYAGGDDFKAGSTVPTVFVDGETDLTIRVNISCHNLNLKNFWGGEWLSTWDVAHTVGDDTFQVVGKIRVNNHYFEQGNIQFQLAKNYKDPVSGTAVDGDVGKGIVATIKELEDSYQASLNQIFEQVEE